MRIQQATRSGFTLMEIMVVIIVIAVLASIAGPMVMNITNAGRVSATKAALGNLKTALVNFNADIGQFPYAGTAARVSGAFGNNSSSGMGDTVETNCLTTNESISGWDIMNVGGVNYKRRWKGPYMDGDPADFMRDVWGNEIKYGHDKKMIYLWSPGPDSAFDSDATTAPGGIASVTSSSYLGDDIGITVARTSWGS